MIYERLFSLRKEKGLGSLPTAEVPERFNAYGPAMVMTLVNKVIEGKAYMSRYRSRGEEKVYGGYIYFSSEIDAVAFKLAF